LPAIGLATAQLVKDFHLPGDLHPKNVVAEEVVRDISPIREALKIKILFGVGRVKNAGRSSEGSRLGKRS